MLLPLLLPLLIRAGELRTGAEQPERYLPLLRGLRIALVANSASVVGPGKVHLLDTLLACNVNVVRIFCPEHGFRDFADAGEEIADNTDPVSGLPVVSLYGKRKKPSREDMGGLDAVVFDLQDVGVRFFTYISTLTLVMEACAEAGIPLILLDRPNPNGFCIDGPVLEPAFSSFVGLHPVPILYGMTIGEYAGMVNGENWLSSGLSCRLSVVGLENYVRAETRPLPVKPSPNLPNLNAILLYPSLCLFEGTVVSVGRGTRYPFEVYGHPDLISLPFTFTPESIPGMSKNPPYQGKVCHGVDLRKAYSSGNSHPWKLNLTHLCSAFELLGGDAAFFNTYFDKLAGTASLRVQIMAGKNEDQIRQSWQPGLDGFKEIRKNICSIPNEGQAILPG